MRLYWGRVADSDFGVTRFIGFSFEQIGVIRVIVE
jgi:hypothetical protein